LLLGVATRQRAAPVVVEQARASSPADLEVVVDAAPLEEPEAPRVPGEPRAGAAPRALRVGRVERAPAPSAPSDEAVAEASPGDGASDAAPGPAAAASAAPLLSLAQLGVAGVNPFVDRGNPATVRAAKAKAVQRRLDRALAQGLNDADVARGRGAQGPMLRSLEAAVYASNAPLNGAASFVFEIDGNGTVTSATVGEATGDRTEWVRVARKAAASYAAKKSTLRKGQGVRLTVAVTSHLELPSGADPGLEISAQGVPLKKGDGPRSTRLDLSIFPFPAATLAGDPADLAAVRPRRMVHANVVSEELL